MQVTTEIENEINSIFESWWKYYNRVHFTKPIPEEIVNNQNLEKISLKNLMYIAFKEGYLMRQEDLENIVFHNSLWKKLFPFKKKRTYIE